MERVILELRDATNLPLLAKPNAGEPRCNGGRLRYPVSPEEFVPIAARLAPHVAVLGGCCGMTPKHIAAITRAVRQFACGGSVRFPEEAAKRSTTVTPEITDMPEM